MTELPVYEAEKVEISALEDYDGVVLITITLSEKFYGIICVDEYVTVGLMLNFIGSGDT